MVSSPHSVVVIAPQAIWDDIREFWQSQGYEIGNGVEMPATGSAPVTHRGAHMWLTDDENQTFTLRQNPQSYANGYNFGQATACMNRYRARDKGQNINHGPAPDASRTGRLSIDYPDNGGTLTKRAHFDQLAAENSLLPIEAELP